MSGLLTTSVFAADVTVEGNGSKSTNSVTVVSTCTSAVNQSSNTSASTVVDSSANSGKNSANGNTGDGSVTVDTGNSTSMVSVSVTGGDNNALSDNCCACQTDPSVSVLDNAYKSTNTVLVSNTLVNSVNQSSKTKASTLVSSKANSGRNSAKWNTGEGNVQVMTGSSKSKVKVAIQGGVNNLLNP